MDFSCSNSFAIIFHNEIGLFITLAHHLQAICHPQSASWSCPCKKRKTITSYCFLKHLWHDQRGSESLIYIYTYVIQVAKTHILVQFKIIGVLRRVGTMVPRFLKFTRRMHEKLKGLLKNSHTHIISLWVCDWKVETTQLQKLLKIAKSGFSPSLS